MSSPYFCVKYIFFISNEYDNNRSNLFNTGGGINPEKNKGFNFWNF